MDTRATDDHAHPEALELRVLHGPQAGSTLPFEPGQTYMLGTADSCEVLLAGTQVEEEHATLTAYEDSIHVMPVQGRVMTIDRGEVTSDETLPLGTVLRLGRVKLTIDRVDAPWPQDDALEEPDPPQAAVSTADDEEASEEEHLEDDPEPELPEAAAPLPEPAFPAAVRGRGRSRKPALLLGTAAMLLMGAAVAAALVTTESGQPADADAVAEPRAAAVLHGGAKPPVDPVVDIAELARSFPEGSLKATKGANGRWVVSGRMASEEGRSRLRQYAAALPAAPEVRVMLDSERLTAVTQFAEKRRAIGEMELRVQQNGAGGLRVVGAASTQAHLAAMMDAARTELQDAGPVDFAILLRSELPARFEDKLRAAGIASKFRVLRREPQMELQAVLTGPEVKTWENVFLDFTRDYGSVLTIQAKVQHERDTIEKRIETVVGGAFPFVVTTDGTRVAPGGTLEGRTLTAIRDGELVFSDGLRLRYAN